MLLACSARQIARVFVWPVCIQLRLTPIFSARVFDSNYYWKVNDWLKVGRFYVRLEAGKDDHVALAFLRSTAYQQLAIYRDKNPVGLHKRIRRYTDVARHKPVPWIGQSTSFTVGRRR